MHYNPPPNTLACRSGVDGLAHDPVAGSWALSPRGYAAVAAEAAGWGLPLLVLGGGGYHDAAAARAWAAVLAALLGEVSWSSGGPIAGLNDRCLQEYLSMRPRAGLPVWGGVKYL